MRKRFFALIAAFLMLVCVLSGGCAVSGVDAKASAAAYTKFRAAGDLSVPIPGLEDGVIPQGITYLQKDDALLFAGYCDNGENSVLLSVSRETGKVLKQVKLRNADGSAYTGHAGGVCATETDIYVSNAHMLFRISLAAYEALPKEAFCSFEEEIPVPVNSSYCSCADGVLWVGEFQYGGDYPTDFSHRVTTKDGIQRAWTCGYRMEAGQDFSVPDYILSMTERIQGMTTLNGRIYLSQSYGRKNDSVLYRYADVLSGDPDETVDLNGKEVPLWILDSTVREAALMAPPMAECVCTVGDELYLVFESAAQKYRNPANPSVHPMDRVFRLDGF